MAAWLWKEGLHESGAAEQRIEADEQPLFVACSPLNAVLARHE
jgi:hypothetical protein